MCLFFILPFFKPKRCSFGTPRTTSHIAKKLKYLNIASLDKRRPIRLIVT